MSGLKSRLLDKIITVMKIIQTSRLSMDKAKLDALIPTVPFKGVAFKDIQGILSDPDALIYTVEELEKLFNKDSYDIILGLDARGFVFGPIMAVNQHKPFVMCRKEGKLPQDCFKVEYMKEYGPDTLCIEKSSIKPGQKVLIIDDLLATGGTAIAASKLVRTAGAEVTGVAVVIALDYLNGRDPLVKENIPIKAVLEYPDFPK